VEESARRAGSLVRLAGSGLIVPPSCACCGEPAARSELLRSSGRRYELIIGYCEDCSSHVGAERARKLAGGIGSMLLGLGLAFALPLSPRPVPPVALAALTLLGALLPIGVVALWPRRPGRGHAAEGPAVRALSEDQLLVANDRWAAEFARNNDLGRERATFRESRISLGMLPGPVLAPLLAVLAYGTTSPVIRVINLSGERIQLEVDGTHVADVDPTSVESPAAGVELRISVGRHELVARGPSGELLERTPVTIQSGRAHLFAPGSNGFCFWLETSGYGRSQAPAITREPLGGTAHFWSLPENLGGWFLPAPAAALAEARLTGGVVTVLRQAPCEP
jgi:hypothetical protein